MSNNVWLYIAAAAIVVGYAVTWVKSARLRAAAERIVRRCM